MFGAMVVKGWAATRAPSSPPLAAAVTALKKDDLPALGLPTCSQEFVDEMLWARGQNVLSARFQTSARRSLVGKWAELACVCLLACAWRPYTGQCAAGQHNYQRPAAGDQRSRTPQAQVHAPPLQLPLPHTLRPATHQASTSAATTTAPNDTTQRLVTHQADHVVPAPALQPVRVLRHTAGRRVRLLWWSPALPARSALPLLRPTTLHVRCQL